MRQLKDKSVLVVGGSSGIGLGIGEAFALEGAKVTLFGRAGSVLEQAKPASPVADAGVVDDRFRFSLIVEFHERKV